MEHILNDLVTMGYSDMFIDGELVYKNKEGLKELIIRKFGNG